MTSRPNTQGISTIEVAIALGVAAVGAVFLMQSVQNTLKLGKTVSTAGDLMGLSNLLSRTLERPEANVCRLNFQDLVFATASSDASQSAPIDAVFPVVHDPAQPNNPKAFILSSSNPVIDLRPSSNAGRRYGGLRINRLEIRPIDASEMTTIRGYPGSDVTPIQANLHIEAERTDPGMTERVTSMGSRLMTVDLPMSVSVAYNHTTGVLKVADCALGSTGDEVTDPQSLPFTYFRSADFSAGGLPNSPDNFVSYSDLNSPSGAAPANTNEVVVRNEGGTDYLYLACNDPDTEKVIAGGAFPAGRNSFPVLHLPNHRSGVNDYTDTGAVVSYTYPIAIKAERSANTRAWITCESGIDNPVGGISWHQSLNVNNNGSWCGSSWSCAGSVGGSGRRYTLVAARKLSVSGARITAIRASGGSDDSGVCAVYGQSSSGTDSFLVASMRGAGFKLTDPVAGNPAPGSILDNAAPNDHLNIDGSAGAGNMKACDLSPPSLAPGGNFSPLAGNRCSYRFDGAVDPWTGDIYVLAFLKNNSGSQHWIKCSWEVVYK